MNPFFLLTFFGVHLLTWRFACNSAVDCRARTIRIIDAHRKSQRFVAGADEKLTVFLELETQARRA
jgi:hypothetical protein